MNVQYNSHFPGCGREKTVARELHGTLCGVFAFGQERAKRPDNSNVPACYIGSVAATRGPPSWDEELPVPPVEAVP